MSENQLALTSPCSVQTYHRTSHPSPACSYLPRHDTGFYPGGSAYGACPVLQAAGQHVPDQSARWSGSVHRQAETAAGAAVQTTRRQSRRQVAADSTEAISAYELPSLVHRSVDRSYSICRCDVFRQGLLYTTCRQVPYLYSATRTQVYNLQCLQTSLSSKPLRLVFHHSYTEATYYIMFMSKDAILSAGSIGNIREISEICVIRLKFLDIRWPWPLTFWTENWHIALYSCRGKRLRQF